MAHSSLFGPDGTVNYDYISTAATEYAVNFTTVIVLQVSLALWS